MCSNVAPQCVTSQMSFHAKLRRLFDRRFDNRLARTAILGTLLVPAAATAATPTARLATRRPCARRSHGGRGGVGGIGVRRRRRIRRRRHDERTRERVRRPPPRVGAAARPRRPSEPRGRRRPYRARVYVVGGYTALRKPSRDVFAITRSAVARVRAPAPEPRAAGGAAILGRRLYVVGGVSSTGLARRTLVLDLERALDDGTRPDTSRASLSPPTADASMPSADACAATTRTCDSSSPGRRESGAARAAASTGARRDGSRSARPLARLRRR